ncbi:MAG TPA: hypothetical protein VFM21_03260 [Terriglobia bacterium]|nr:hypothetical protein [Terriglobia bacterium]
MSESEKTAASPASGANSRRVSPWLLFLLLFIAYNANFRTIHFGDTVPSSVLPFSLLLDHTWNLDRWFDNYVPPKGVENGMYYLRPSRGHRMSAYPIIMPLSITPLYILPAWVVARQNPPLAREDIVMLALIEVMEKLSASLIAALSGVVLFLAFRKVCSPGMSLMLALIYGLASSTWCISSQALWRHGFTELSFAFLIWGLLPGQGSGKQAFWCGVALAGAGANGMSNIVVILAVVAYFARQGKREFTRFFAPLAAVGILVLIYNYYFFGRLQGGYPSFIVHGGGATHLFKGAPTWEAVLGLFISPSRGLMIYMPWTVLAVWGMVRAWKRNTYGWERYLIAGTAGVFVEHSLMGRWWGGWSFGPRYLVDILPLLVFFLIPVWPRIQASTLLRAATVASLAAALWLQFLGSFYYPNGAWDDLPINVDQSPHRLWDLEDNPIRRTWQAGAARPNLFYKLFLLPTLLENSSAQRLPASDRPTK